MKSQDSRESKSNLKTLRESRELTQLELGRQVGVSDRSIRDYEEGVAIPRLDKAIRLAKALKVSLKELCEVMGLDVVDLPGE